MLLTSKFTIFYTAADLAVLINLTTKLNEFNIDCQDKNYWRHLVFQNKPKVAKYSANERCANPLLKCSKSHWSHDVSLYIVCSGNAKQRVSNMIQRLRARKFHVSFITNLSEGRIDGSEYDKFIFSVFKENVCELDFETSNFHLDLSLKT